MRKTREQNETENAKNAPSAKKKTFGHMNKKRVSIGVISFHNNQFTIGKS